MPTTLDDAIERVQFCYPQIYYACHTRHVRKKSNALHVSARDSEMLVHLDRVRPTTVTSLASHMDLSASTVSEAIAKLESHGYVVKHRGTSDRRQVGLVLTAKGVDTVRATSVLEARKLRAVLGALSPRDLRRTVAGLVSLADACRRLPSKRRR